MRKFWLSLCSIVLFVSLPGNFYMNKATAQNASPAAISAPCGNDPSQEGCWLFSEGSGTTTADGSGNGNTGTLVDNTMWTTDRFGNAGSALNFNGSSQYVQIPDSSSLDITGDISIVAWVKPLEVKTQDVVKKAVTTGTLVNGYELALSTTGSTCTPGTNPCAFGRFNNSPTNDAYRINAMTPYTNSDPWTLYVVTYTSTDNTLHIYRDGNLSNTRVPSSQLAIAVNNLSLIIGAQLGGSVSPDRYFHGSIDDVRLYKRALSLLEIKSLYNNITPSGYTCTNLQPQAATANTEHKPMSKVWYYEGKWWSVFPASTGVSPAGAWLWRLDNASWTPVLNLSTNTAAKADVKPSGSPEGSVVHILLYNGSSADLASVQYSSGSYIAWSSRPSLISIALPGSETATIDVDSAGRMWLNSQHDVTSPSNSREIVAYYSDSPYTSWSSVIVLGTGTVYGDDISLVNKIQRSSPAFSTIGVLWSNQSTGRFVFRYHIDGDPPSNWSTEELPTSQFGYTSPGAGFADDHINVAVASDGTMYTAIKTGYDTTGYPKIALMVRRLSGNNGAGVWDANIYGVSETGTRGIALLDESAGVVNVIYSSVEGGGNIVYKQTAIQPISFGSIQTMRSGTNNDVSSTKQNIDGELVAIYSSGTTINGSLCTEIPSGGVDLSITKTDNKNAAIPGETSTYTIVVSNGSTSAVNGATIADTFPASLTLISWTCTPGPGSSCTASGSGNINDTIYLAASGSVTYAANATISPTASGVIANRASVTLPNGITDPNLANNTATDNTVIRSGGDSCGSDDNLVACYQLDEGVGNVYLDGVQNNTYNDGTTIGNPSWITGVMGNALVLNGTDQYGSTANESSLNITGALTLAAWIRPGKTGTQHLIQKGISTGGSPANDGYELSLSTSGRVFFRLNYASGSPTDIYRVDSQLSYPTDGTWMHVAGTYDPLDPNHIMHIYINGVQNDDAITPGPVSIGTNTTALYLGRDPGTTNGYFYQGGVDDVRVYNRALSAVEIAALADQPPSAPASPIPSNGSVAGLQAPDFHTDLQTTVADPDTPSNLAVSFYGEPFSTQNFSLVVLPDTQNYVAGLNGGTRAMFDAQTSWIVNNQAARNIVYVTHVGDIVNTYSTLTEWGIAGALTNPKGALTALDDAHIPYGLSLGNHDGAPSNTTNYNTTFPSTRIGTDHYGTDNDNHYGLFTVGNLSFIVIQLEYNASPDTAVLAWADGLLNADTNRRGIIVFHDLVASSSGLSTAGQVVYDYLKHNPNLFLMLGGHTTTEVTLTLTDSGHTVYALRSDYQDRTGGNGWLRIMEFQPSNNQIQVYTYSPYLNQWETDADSQFTLTYNMGARGLDDYELIGTVTGVSSGSDVSVPWPSLTSGTNYHWYVTVSDGIRTTLGPTWWFTGGSPTPNRLSDLTSTALPQGIMVSWRTAQESDLLGFNVYRSESIEGLQVQINSSLITAFSPGQMQGNDYLFIDRSAELGKTYLYWVEWVDNRSSEYFGPVNGYLLPYAVWLPMSRK